MATITPVSPAVAGTVSTTQALTSGADVIPASAYNLIFLILRSVSTGTPTTTIDDPTSQTPSGAQAFNPDVQVTLTAAQTKIVRLDCGRFRDVNGNINITTTTPGDAVVSAIGI